MTSFYTQLSTTPLEFWGSITALLCVWLAAKEHVWNWPVSIFSTVLFAMVFYDARLFSDALLQLVFIGFQIFGWIQWVKKIPSKNQVLEMEFTSNYRIHFLNNSLRFTYALSIVFSTLAWYFILIKFRPNASLPEFDSVIFVISIYAIFLQAIKAMESWLLWILVDVISVPVYIYKELYFTSIVYFIFIGLAIYGYKQWRKRL